MSKNKAKTVEEFDRRFDEGESIFELAEVKSVSHPNLEVQRVNIDFPKHFLVRLDREAQLRGVSRQALIKTWLYEHLQFATSNYTRGAGSSAGVYAAPSSVSGAYEARSLPIQGLTTSKSSK